MKAIRNYTTARIHMQLLTQGASKETSGLELTRGVRFCQDDETPHSPQTSGER